MTSFKIFDALTYPGSAPLCEKCLAGAFLKCILSLNRLPGKHNSCLKAVMSFGRKLFASITELKEISVTFGIQVIIYALGKIQIKEMRYSL